MCNFWKLCKIKLKIWNVREKERVRSGETVRRRERGFMILPQNVVYRSSNRAAVQRQTYFLCQVCLPVAYTVFCDEDSGGWPSSFQMDVLHHEFSESMFCRYITRPRVYARSRRAYTACTFRNVPESAASPPSPRMMDPSNVQWDSLDYARRWK